MKDRLERGPSVSDAKNGVSDCASCASAEMLADPNGPYSLFSLRQSLPEMGFDVVVKLTEPRPRRERPDSSVSGYVSGCQDHLIPATDPLPGVGS